MSLTGKVVIVTGAAQGIGKAYAERLARDGAKVVVADIDFALTEATAAAIRDSGGEVTALGVDVSSKDSTLEMARATVDRYGRVDVLVNNAALFAALLPTKPFTEITEEEWDRVMAVNVKGLLLCCQAVFPYMKSQGKGKIINISSGTFWTAPRDFLHYVTSKGAVVGFTRALARELGEHGINVNCITPGLTASEGAMRGYTRESLDARAAARCIQRWQVPEDLVGTVAFLASDDSDFITGQVINVDGGAAFN